MAAAGAAARVVVAGAGGRVGRLLADAWAREPPPGLDLVVTARRAPAAGASLGWDIEAEPPPAAARGAAVLLSLAGVTAGPEVGRNAALALAALERAREAGIGHVFLVSSAAVYGAVPAGLAREEDALRPAGGYGAAKAAMEAAVRERLRRAGPGAPGVTLLRLANVVGADALGASLAAGGPVTLDDVGPAGAPEAAGAPAAPEAGEARGAPEAGEAGAAADAAARGAPGGPVRSWIGPATLARVLAELAARAAAGAALPGVVNIAAPVPLPMAALVRAAGRPLAFRPAPPGVLARVALDTERLAALLPLRPEAATAAALVAEAAALGALGPRSAAPP